MIGVLVNAIGVIICSVLGTKIGMRFSKDLQEQILNLLGICVVVIGVSSALKGENILLTVCSCAIGVIIGYLLDIDGRLNALGRKVNSMFSREGTESTFIEGFVTSTLIFCIGSMGIVGSINAGLMGDNSMLFTKAILDSVISIALASTLGIGVAFSGVIIFLYQGMFVLLASVFKDVFTASMITSITGVGGVLIIAIGLNIMEIKKLKNANMIPALVIPIVYELLTNAF